MRTLFLIFLVFIPCVIAAQDYSSPSLWQEADLVIDGQNEEWEQPFKYYNTTASLRFSIANDADYLYLSFETYEPYNIVKMLRAGWAFRLSSKERKKKFNVSVDFKPIRIELDPKHDYTANEDKQEPTFENWLDDYNLTACSYEIKGFKQLKKGIHVLTDSMDLKIRMGYTTEKAVYEIAIPLSREIQE